MFRESLIKNVAALQAVTPFQHLILSGRLLEMEPVFVDRVATDLSRFGTVTPLQSLPGAWVKHAAQGAAVLADGLAGGRYRGLVEQAVLRAAQGTILDWLRHPCARRGAGGFRADIARPGARRASKGHLAGAAASRAGYAQKNLIRSRFVR